MIIFDLPDKWIRIFLIHTFDEIYYEDWVQRFLNTGYHVIFFYNIIILIAGWLYGISE